MPNYSANDLKKMNIEELSQLIGYDYRDFIQEGGTAHDALAIANGRKTLEEVIGVEPPIKSGLSTEQLEIIRKRTSPALAAIVNLFGMVVFIIVFYSVATAIGLPDSLVLMLAFTFPIVYIIVRNRQSSS
ncbi:MAG: hypothetical protein AAFV93_05255 [Chloroflexota bacterium]